MFKILMLLFIVVSCSKSNQNNNPKTIEDQLNVELSPLQLSVDGSGNISPSSMDFASLAYKQSASQDLILYNPSSTLSFTYTSQDFDQSLISPFQILSNGCLIPLGPRKKCIIKLSVSNSASLSTEQNISSLIKVKNQDVLLTAIFQADTTDYNAPSTSITVTPATLNFGIIKSGEFSELNVAISNTSVTTVALNLQTTLPSSITIVSNSCPSSLIGRKTCAIKLKYTASLAESVTEANLLKIANNQVKYSVVAVVPSLNEPEILTSVTPLTNNLSLSLNNSTSSTGTIRFQNNMISTFFGPISGVSSSNGLVVTGVSCAGGIARGKFCDLNYSYNSALLPIGISAQTLKLQSGTKASSSYTINFDIASSGVACEIADAQANGWNTTKAQTIGGFKLGMDVSACVVSTCIASYQPDTLNKKCLVNLDPDNDDIVSNAEFNLLLADANSGYISSTVVLDSSKTYEFDDQIVVPSNVTIQGVSPASKAVIRKKNDLINGIDKTVAQNIKNLVVANLPLVMFNGSGEVTGYNGVSGVAGMQNAMNALTAYYEANDLLDPVVVAFGAKRYRFDLDGYGNRCWNATGESFVCPLTVPTGATKFTPFFQDILNTPVGEFSQFNKNTVTPIFLIESANVSLKNLDIACPNDVPYFPIHEMVNVGNPKANGEPPTFNGSRVVSGFVANAIYLSNAMNVDIENVKVQNCNLAVYSINSRSVNIVNNEFLTNVKETSLHSIASKEQGDFQSAWKHRFHGINAIRIHGTLDRNFLIKSNTFGTATSGAQKAIHIHGTSLSNRDHDNDDLADAPAQGFTTNDQGLIALGPYADRSTSASLRKNFKVISNNIQGQHTSGIDFEGDQLNAEIRDNVITNIKDKFFIPAAQSTIDGGVGIRILTEVSPINLFNKFGSGSDYNLDFVGSPKNFLIQNNSISDSNLGIMLVNRNNDLTLNFAFDNFPVAPLTPINTNYNCSLASMNANCSNQVSVISNQVHRMQASANAIAQFPNGVGLQSSCLSISGMVGVEVKNNIFDTCNVPLYTFAGNPSAISVVNSKKVHFSGNMISIDSASQSARQALPDSGSSSRYYGIRFQVSGAANISTVTKLVASETLISGCASNVSCLTSYNFKVQAGGINGTVGTQYTNENVANDVPDALSPYLFIPSSELNDIIE